MLDIPGLDQELPQSEFPAKYLQAHEWGWSSQDADEVNKYFVNFNACHLPNPYNDDLTHTLSVSYATNPTHSQCYGGYQDPTKPKNKAQADEEDHCAGLILPSTQAPDCIRKLQAKLNAVLHSMPGYEKHQINYLSVMHYPDENSGIVWHKHSEDDGCDTPVLLVSTGAVRDFYLGENNHTKPPAPTAFWRRPAEHGSLIVIPDAMNYTHWHAILKNTPQNRNSYGVPNIPYGPRISINTKCLRPPRVFAIRDRHPRWAVYVGRKYGQFPATPYGNYANIPDSDPPEVKQTKFRIYAEGLLRDPSFRARAIQDLKGKHLLCWCRPDAPFCHARIWLDIMRDLEPVKKL
jgi:hypothetical protein